MVRRGRFSGVKFKKKTDFEEARLLGTADFSGASFARVPAFTDGVFNAAAENLFEVSAKSKQPLPLRGRAPARGRGALTASRAAGALLSGCRLPGRGVRPMRGSLSSPALS